MSTSLNETITEIFRDPLTDEKVSDIAKEYLRVKTLIKSREATAKEMKASLKEISERLYRRMNEEGMTRIGIDGVNIGPRDVYWASMAMGNEEALKQIRDMELERLIKKTVNSQTFSAEIRRRIEADEIFFDDEEEKWKRRIDTVLNNDITEDIHFSIIKKQEIGVS